MGMAEPLPEGIASLLPAARATVERGLVPATAEERSALMQRLWDSGVPQPHVKIMTEWHRLLAEFPPDILASAFDQVAKTHRWPHPPAVADVVRFAQPLLSRRTDWRNKLRRAQMRADSDAEKAKPRGQMIGEMDSGDREAFFADLRRRYPQGFAQAAEMMEQGQ
jgi:hypothetical protein